MRGLTMLGLLWTLYHTNFTFPFFFFLGEISCCCGNPWLYLSRNPTGMVMCQFYTRFGNLDTMESHRKTNVCIGASGLQQPHDCCYTFQNANKCFLNANNLKTPTKCYRPDFLLVIIYVKFHLQRNPVASEGDYFLFSPYNITPKLNIKVTRIMEMITN